MGYRAIRESKRGPWDPDKESSIGKLTPLENKDPYEKLM